MRRLGAFPYGERVQEERCGGLGADFRSGVGSLAQSKCADCGAELLLQAVLSGWVRGEQAQRLTLYASGGKSVEYIGDLFAKLILFVAFGYGVFHGRSNLRVLNAAVQTIGNAATK